MPPALGRQPAPRAPAALQIPPSVVIEIDLPSEDAIRRMPGLGDAQGASKWLRNLGNAFASGTFKFVRQNATALIGAGAEFGLNYLVAQNLDEDPGFARTFICTGVVVTSGIALGLRAGFSVRGAVLARHSEAGVAADLAGGFVAVAAVLVPLGAAQTIAIYSGRAAANSFMVWNTTHALGNAARDLTNEFVPRTGVDGQDRRGGQPMDGDDALRERAGSSMLASIVPNALAAALGDRVLPDALGGGALGRILADGVTKGNFALVNEASRAVGASMDGPDGGIRVVRHAQPPDRDFCDHLQRWSEDTAMRTALDSVPFALHALADHLLQPGDGTHTALKGCAYFTKAISEFRGPVVELDRVYQRDVRA